MNILIRNKQTFDSIDLGNRFGKGVNKGVIYSRLGVGISFMKLLPQFIMTFRSRLRNVTQWFEFVGKEISIVY